MLARPLGSGLARGLACFLRGEASFGDSRELWDTEPPRAEVEILQDSASGVLALFMYFESKST